MSTTDASTPRGLIRQGDVLLVPVESVPEGTRVERRGNVVLARGEATGHAHRIVDERAELRTDGLGSRFLVVAGVEPVTLGHEEHDPIVVAAGAWEIRRQREYVPASRVMRWVSD
jgi:hypothetical protein